ncbi:hypothetical protein SSX86_029839 [Deinandra increscens subsp. villosa]|uniref:Transmembrane protein n=1 Tax=Deinandra increscens subsp. villosa TaxID=3103831 RepID=A0AAP0CFN9_9ASTR
MLQLLTHRSRAIWLSCLSTSLYTATACSIVAAATLFSPSSLRRHVTFPAFSYVTVILIVIGASLGDTLRGCWGRCLRHRLNPCPDDFRVLGDRDVTSDDGDDVSVGGGGVVCSYVAGSEDSFGDDGV